MAWSFQSMLLEGIEGLLDLVNPSSPSAGGAPGKGAGDARPDPCAARRRLAPRLVFSSALSHSRRRLPAMTTRSAAMGLGKRWVRVDRPLMGLYSLVVAAELQQNISAIRVSSRKTGLFADCGIKCNDCVMKPPERHVGVSEVEMRFRIGRPDPRGIFEGSCGLLRPTEISQRDAEVRRSLDEMWA